MGRPSLLLTAVPPAGSDEDTKAHTSDQPEVTRRGRGLGGVACVPCEIPREVMACALRGAPLPQGARGSWLVMWSLVSGCPFRLATE